MTVAVATLASCSKDSTTKPSTTTTPPSTTPSSGAPSPTYTTGDGAIVALLTKTSSVNFGIPVDLELGTGVAVFGNLSTGTYTDAGKITLNDKELTKQSNNSYVYTPEATNPTGIDDFDTQIKWMVTTPSFTYNAKTSGRSMPYGGNRISTSITTVNTASDFTLSAESTIYNADSIYFQVVGSKGVALKRMGNNVKSVTFTAAELSSIGASTAGSVTIAAWNHEYKSLGGKNIHVINELALSKIVEVK